MQPDSLNFDRSHGSKAGHSIKGPDDKPLIPKVRKVMGQ